MKLYTEEQLRIAMSKSFLIGYEIHTKQIIESLKFIELPSDEEIEKFSEIFNHLNNRDMFNTGAHWVLNQIKQQDEIN